ncbi:MAG: hypothetical protein BKP49_10345 [Treponema sp. CETP13]|nr:MAG: hypothetical protein BKP49_10345 [Treponema sp. CETP13]
MAKSDKNKKSGITAAVWVLFTLIIVIIFLVKQNDIMTVLKETDFFKYVFGQNPEFVEKFEAKKTDNEDSILLQNENDSQTEFTLNDDNKLIEKKGTDNLDSDLSITEGESSNKEGASKDELETTTSKETESSSVSKKTKTDNTSDIKADEKSKVDETAKSTASIPKMKEYLCFIVIEANGSLTRKDAIRKIPKTGMPLTAALNDLLEGPSYDESKKGYISLIPDGTRLISASIKDGVSRINFSSEFLYNKYGVDGFRGQLMQIVYTATEFSTIDSVQILIDGEKTDFLGGEGIWIGSPLTRRDFS